MKTIKWNAGSKPQNWKAHFYFNPTVTWLSEESSIELHYGSIIKIYLVEQTQRIKAQRNKVRGIKWTAFTPGDLNCNPISFLASLLLLNKGKTLEASFFNGGELMESGSKSTENSSKLREVLEDLYILNEECWYGVKERRKEWQILYTQKNGIF